MLIHDAHAMQLARGILREHMSAVNSVAFCSNISRLVSGSEDNTVHYWNCGEGVSQSTVDDSAHEPQRCYLSGFASAMSANNNIVAVSRRADFGISLYDTERLDFDTELSIDPIVDLLCTGEDGEYFGLICKEAIIV